MSMRSRTRLVSIIVSTAIVIGSVPVFADVSMVSSSLTITKQNTSGNLNNFKTVRTLKKYIDLKSTDKNYKYLKLAYELGLMNDHTAGKKMEPNAYITVGETVQAVAQINSLFKTGKLTRSGIDYATQNGIINPTDYPNMNKFATRAELADILANALPHDYMVADKTQVHPDIKNNSVTCIPDCDASTKNYEAIKLLYQGGIMKGVDAQGSFKPNANITRAEVAAMLNNIVKPADRKMFTQTSGKTVDSTVVSTQYQYPTLFKTTAHSEIVPKGTRLYYNDSVLNDGGKPYVHGGKSDYTQENIKTRFGKHVYGCRTQAEYDELLTFMDRCWAKYQAEVQSKGYAGSFNEQQAIKDLDKLGLGLEYKDAVKYAVDKWGDTEPAGDFLSGITVMYFMPPHDNPASLDADDNRARAGNAETEQKVIAYSAFSPIVYEESRKTSSNQPQKEGRISKSLFDVFLLNKGPDCESAAFQDMIVGDYLGINTRMVGGGSHAWCEYELNSDRGMQWVHNENAITYGGGVTGTESVIHAPTVPTQLHKEIITGKLY